MYNQLKIRFIMFPLPQNETFMRETAWESIYGANKKNLIEVVCIEFTVCPTSTFILKVRGCCSHEYNLTVCTLITRSVQILTPGAPNKHSMFVSVLSMWKHNCLLLMRGFYAWNPKITWQSTTTDTVFRHSMFLLRDVLLTNVNS